MPGAEISDGGSEPEPSRSRADADRLLAQLHNLRMVSAIVARGSSTAAARSLDKSPSALTRAVAELERALGLSLLERRRTGMTPTPFGRSLLARFERIEGEIAAARAELARLPGSSSAGIGHLLYSGRKLLLLIQLANAGTVFAAAASLTMTQPGLSMALARIEESLGIVLFHRGLRGVSPTDAAARLILRAQRIRAELRHALAELSSLAGDPSGMTVIGTLPMARADILPRAIGNCLEASPHLRVQVVEAQREALLAQLRTGEIDAVLSVPGADFDPRDLIVEPLFRDALGVIARAGHKLASAPRVALAELAAAKWILPMEKAVSRALFDDQFVRNGIAPPDPAVQTGDLLIMRPLLARGEMLAFTSLSLVRFEIDAGFLVRIDTEMDEVGREVVLLRRETANLPASTLSLLAEIHSVAAAASRR